MQMGERRLLVGALDLEQAAIADIEGPEHALLAEGRAIAQRRKGLFVEEPALVVIAHFDGDVVDRDVSWRIATSKRVSSSMEAWSMVPTPPRTPLN